MKNISLLFILSGLVFFCNAQVDSTFLKSSAFNALEFRNIGPALTSGRIADIVIHPDNQNTMYVAVGSGNVWKTTNAGTTWTPIFENKPSYSIGCITLDPNNPHTLWLGTGENVGGRHVGFGDGIYMSPDGGKSWKHMGLKKSEHIGKIIVHPTDPNTIWVAAQGPLWSKGGERGLYKSTDGGNTWNRKLGNNEWTGATDIIIDPRNPEVLYCATWDRHRTVAAYMGGGPGTAIYRSNDGGETWEKLTSGIPKSNLGKIGLCLNPFNPDQIYAAIELDRKKGGLFMSTDRGSSWTKQSDMVSGGTGPHYYQELYADPHKEGRLYLMNNYVLISDDHGKTYDTMNEKNKHVDTHAIAWRKGDPNYIIMGTDGGLYETFDRTKTWKHVRNLPLTQYYKLAVDNAKPFYNVYGGTQDNGSHKGPSQTLRSSGIMNRDWEVVLGADGHQSATEPGNPNISYGEFQEGFLWRIDHKTKEAVYIRPEPGLDEPYERFNWDAPILVSQHDPKRLYFASQRVWRSDNRGDDWTAISEDLTRNQNRIELPIMGRKQSWDNAWDVDAMSNYNTITSLAESSKDENLIYAGTDDGIIQISDNGGKTWTKVEARRLSGLPSTAFVNDLRGDLHDGNTVYAVFDNHKYGDFKPYIYVSTNKGQSWKNISSNLPDRLPVWRIVQDHIDPNLLFIATEFGIYFSSNGGSHWTQLKGGLPTISFRDITIQRQEEDLVAASFGRGFYILDDISVLRQSTADVAKSEAKLYPIKNTPWYNQTDEIYGQGDAEYLAKNPPFGASITYFLKDGYSDAKKDRLKSEKDLNKSNRDVPFPGWDKLDEERLTDKTELKLVIFDEQGEVVNKLKAPAKKGLNRTNWQLDVASKNMININAGQKQASWWDTGRGYLAAPGKYSAKLIEYKNGKERVLDGPVYFDLTPLLEPTLTGAKPSEMVAFRKRYETFQSALTLARADLNEGFKNADAMVKAYNNADKTDENLYTELKNLRKSLINIETLMYGNRSKREIGEKNNPTPSAGSLIGWTVMNSTYGPTGNHKGALTRAETQLKDIGDQLKEVVKIIPELKKKLLMIGAPIIR